MAERVGFEPTVAFATLDFESSALDRTQPSLRGRDASRDDLLVKILVKIVHQTPRFFQEATLALRVHSLKAALHEA